MGIDPMTHQPRTDVFSCLPQLISLAYIKEMLEQNQLAQNLQIFNLLHQTNTGLSTLLNRTNSQQENHDFVNEIPVELNQENEDIKQFLLGNSNLTQPLHHVSIMNLQTHGQSRFTSTVNSSSSSPLTWSPIPPLMDTININKSGSLDSGSTISYAGDVGASSSFNWPEFLFEDSFLDQNLREIC
ncbi:hypothetical protein L1987_42336 [Smallanthus sonchifolius]|uniref:Uncharacterized protein n=1 Tax=Smallanthus sonchifolius TaxID=185202 RepID=A0ACB9GIK5_9ASTR|nr:hypothetical protein L1987_42336 [Smallanthus sonchifolius]